MDDLEKYPSIDWYLAVVSTMDIEDFNAYMEWRV